MSLINFDLVIPISTTDSNVYVLPPHVRSVRQFVIYTPAALTAVVKLQLGATESPLIANTAIANIAGSDVTLAAAKALPFTLGGFKSIAVKAASAEAAARTFTVLAVVDDC